MNTMREMGKSGKMKMLDGNAHQFPLRSLFLALLIRQALRFTEPQICTTVL
jgi:hypothetical protein